MRLEAASWKKLRPCLVALKLDPIRVENPIHPGTPDVNLVTGAWLELKALARWPRRPAAIFRIPHFTPQQRVWLYRRWRSGGETYLVLEVAGTHEWLLFTGEVAARGVGRVTEAEHRALASLVALDPWLIAKQLANGFTPRKVAA